MIARISWTLRYRMAALDYSQISIIVLCLTLLVLIGAVHPRLAEEENALASMAARASTNYPSTRPEYSITPKETSRLPPPTSWLAAQEKLRTMAEGNRIAVASAAHTWDPAAPGLLRVTSTWQWRGNWHDGTKTLITWLNSAPNMAVTQFRSSTAESGDAVVMTVVTETWFRPGSTEQAK